jgi:DNA-binding NtrC family response regulator
MLRILIVEDDDALRDWLVLLLRQAGHEVSAASSAAAARPLLAAADLLLTDLRLPDALAIHQRSLRREQPIVAVNLAALPAGLVDSELFGYERGPSPARSIGARVALHSLARERSFSMRATRYRWRFSPSSCAP